MPSVIFGLIALVLGVLGLMVWWPDFGQVMRGVVPFTLVVVGLLSIASKYNEQNRSSAE